MKKFIKYSLCFIVFSLATYALFEIRWQCRIDFVQSDKVKSQITKMNTMRLTESFWYSEMADDRFLKTLTPTELTEFQAAILYAFPALLNGKSGDASLMFVEILVKDNAENLVTKLKSLKGSKSYFCLSWHIPLVNSWQQKLEGYAEFYKTPQGQEILEWREGKLNKRE